MLSVEYACSNTPAEGSRWVERTPCIVHSYEVSNEEGQANADRSNECYSMLLLSKQKHLRLISWKNRSMNAHIDAL